MDKKANQLKKQTQSYTISKPSIWFLTLSILFFKAIWLSSLPGKGLLGADGENYLEGLSGLLKDGFFSSQGKLLYWPAGYPILIWPFAEMSTSQFPFILGIAQSSLFSLSIVFITFELSKTNLYIMSWPVFFLLSLNPTLALNSSAIGYEVPCASLMTISIAALMKHQRIYKAKPRIITRETILASASLALATFMQPRTALLALGILMPFAWMCYTKKMAICFLVFTVGVIAVAPASLIVRNVIAKNPATISTNLGVTMNIGAGPNSNGGYTNRATGVPCNQTSEDLSRRDRQLVSCVITWYIKNPSQAFHLFWNKLNFHWSPWFGPLANGTMARSPWLDYHPLKGMLETTSGEKFINGKIGVTLSWLWQVSSMALLVFGFITMRRLDGIAEVYSWCLFLPSILNTLSSMATIGDNRFRVPTLMLSLQLQLFGIAYLAMRKNLRAKSQESAK